MAVNHQNRDVLLITLLGIAHGVSHFFHLVIPPTAVQDNLWYEDLKRIKNIIDF